MIQLETTGYGAHPNNNDVWQARKDRIRNLVGREVTGPSIERRPLYVEPQSETPQIAATMQTVDNSRPATSHTAESDNDSTTATINLRIRHRSQPCFVPSCCRS